MLSLAAWRELYEQMEWADARVWVAALHAPAGATDARLRDTLFHMHITQRAFLQLWQGIPRDLPDPLTLGTLAELQAWARPYYREAAQFLATLELDTSRLAEPLAIPWAGRLEQRLGQPPAMATLGDTLLQIPLHGAHHRAQLNGRLRELGVEPPMVDYIAWVWLGRPVPAWSAPR